MTTAPSPSQTPAIAGLHHVTAIAADPQPNLDFYTQTLGLRLVKRTVNFDDPGTYHLYFGDHDGTPGTIFTTFPWPGAIPGRQGAAAATATTFAIPQGSLDWWHARLRDHAPAGPHLRFGQRVLPFTDHDGMSLELVEVPALEQVPAWTRVIDPAHAIRRIDAVTLRSRRADASLALFTEVLGLRLAAREGDRTRLHYAKGPGAIDIIDDPQGPGSKLGAGVVHHVALRARDDAEHARWQRLVAARGLGVTEVRDRSYFRSIYFREPGGVLLEIATDQPGFATDEPRDHLGEALKLPPQFEHARERLAPRLPPLTLHTP